MVMIFLLVTPAILLLCSKNIISGRAGALQAVGGGDDRKQVVPASGVGRKDDQPGNCSEI